MDFGSMLIAGLLGAAGALVGMSINRTLKLRERIRAQTRLKAILLYILVFVVAIIIMVIVLIATSTVFPDSELANRIARDLSMFTILGLALSVFGVIGKQKK